jgi:flagellar M-ring protein FliF
MNEQIQAVLKQLSIYQRIGIIGSALAAAALIGILVMFASKVEYTPAFTKLSAADAGTIESALRTANIPYQLTDAGSTIEVPAAQLGNARIAASKAGVNVDGVSNADGWDLFNKQGFGQSQFDQQVTYQRALEGELTKTVMGMEGVAGARISIVLAQTGALSSQDTPASAAVVLTMTSGSTPSSGLVQAIVNTVSKSVQGLSPENVVVTDDRGHVLAGAAGSSSSTAAQAKDLVEQQIKAKVEGLIAAVMGPGHSSVAVSAEVDTSKVEQQITSYAPTGSNPPVSIHQITEQYGAQATQGACGIPGVNSNVPGLPSYPGLCVAAGTTAAPTAAPTAASSGSPAPSTAPTAAPTAASSAAAGTDTGSGYLHQETTINYSVSQTIQHVVTEPGVVKRLSIAVFVDQDALGTLTADTLKTQIAAAIGSDTTRGDVVAVQAIPFAAQATAAPGASSSSSDMMETVGGMSGTILGAIFAAFMLLLLWLNLGALRRKAEETVYDLGPTGSPSFAPVPSRAGIPASTAAPDAPAAADVPAATPQARIQERLRMVADERPEALVGLMHGWLREEDRRR